MAKLSTASVYDTPMSLTFGSRVPMRDAMRSAIRRAYVMKPESRLRETHDFGLELPVVFAYPDDYTRVAMRGAASHVIVSTEAGKEYIMYLVPSANGRNLVCLVSNGSGVRDFVSSYLTRREWSRDMQVSDGFNTLICDDDGEFAGATVDGATLLTDPEFIDTSAWFYRDVAGLSILPALRQAEPASEFEVAAFLQSLDAANHMMAEAA
jgi:hypothetical protein